MTARRLILEQPTIANYFYLSQRTAFWTYLSNSMLISFASTIVSATIASLAGYALFRYRGAVTAIYSQALFVVQMFRSSWRSVPCSCSSRSLGLINSPLSVIILYSVVHLPFATWMARSFFDSIPRELEEAALIDGCSAFGAFARIVLPLSGPGLAAIAIFSFLFSYNEFFVANLFPERSKRHDAAGRHQDVHAAILDRLGSLMAAATVTLVPTFILFLFVQKYIAYGAALRWRQRLIIVQPVKGYMLWLSPFVSASSVAAKSPRSFTCRPCEI